MLFLAARLGTRRARKVFGYDPNATYPEKASNPAPNPAPENPEPNPAPKPPTPSLSPEVRKNQIALILKDLKSARTYCDEVASRLLEKPTCVFCAPRAFVEDDRKLTARTEEAWEKQYHDQEWIDAWIAALQDEMSVKKVVYAPDKGTGRFILEAI